MRNTNTAEAGPKFYTIEITRRDRFAQWLHGRRDGRRGIPEVPPVADINQQVAIPPHDRSLLSRRDEVAEHERELLLSQSASKASAITRCLQNVLVAVRNRDDAITALAASDRPLAEAELQARFRGEEALPAAGVADRRSKEQAKSLAPKFAAVERAKAAIDGHFLHLAELEEDLTNDVRKAQARAVRYSAYIYALRGLYWRALVRKHADKDRLTGRVPPHADAASWISEPNYRDVIGLTLPPGTENLTWRSVVGGADAQPTIVGENE